MVHVQPAPWLVRENEQGNKGKTKTHQTLWWQWDFKKSQEGFLEEFCCYDRNPHFKKLKLDRSYFPLKCPSASIQAAWSQNLGDGSMLWGKEMPSLPVFFPLGAHPSSADSSQALHIAGTGRARRGRGLREGLGEDWVGVGLGAQGQQCRWVKRGKTESWAGRSGRRVQDKKKRTCHREWQPQQDEKVRCDHWSQMDNGLWNSSRQPRF